MSDHYKILWEGGQGELVEKKSRFIATTEPVETEEEALAFIERTAEEVLGCQTQLLCLLHR